MIFWLAVAFVAGVLVGGFAAALCVVSGRADDAAERLHK